MLKNIIIIFYSLISTSYAQTLELTFEEYQNQELAQGECSVEKMDQYISIAKKHLEVLDPQPEIFRCWYATDKKNQLWIQPIITGYKENPNSQSQKEEVILDEKSLGSYDPTYIHVFYGFNGSDGIVGGTGKDIIFGGKGTDTIEGYTNIDYADGGKGEDFLCRQTPLKQKSNEHEENIENRLFQDPLCQTHRTDKFISAESN